MSSIYDRKYLLIYKCMDYNKVWSLINGKNLSQNKISRILDLSSTGFKLMMDRRTMTVATLEKLAEYFDKPVSYFFDEEENEVSEARVKYESRVRENKLQNCTDKERLIESQRETIETQKMLIEALQSNRKLPNGTSG